MRLATAVTSATGSTTLLIKTMLEKYTMARAISATSTEKRTLNSSSRFTRSREVT